ncbi:MAG: bifunctional demethylmenaquinone methyltransferase/2-methoxy-6-polyprenyl-1,4-benzoquinol methylase UbiE [Planctomycetes bacterium]|nr:bifunctional demethylmenaquinone methyltransferase/2-methoxy-6-polyprenyl-1,4-benzoquinol methylase UbiE [Planctomycetota bacterium]
MTKNGGVDDKGRQLGAVFGGIASRYDLANHVLSCGVDFCWRRTAVVMAAPGTGDRLLDMCCGTGDFAFAFARGCADTGRITGCDFSPEMIELAGTKESRFKRRGKYAAVDMDWQVCDCTATEFESESFDIVSCAFGVRNMADLSAGLKEMHRLLRPGGGVCILEFSLPKNAVIRAAYLPYFRWILPVLGGLISGDYGAYRYLAESVRRWDRQVYLGSELHKAGFREVVARPLTFGIATVHVGHKPHTLNS